MLSRYKVQIKQSLNSILRTFILKNWRAKIKGNWQVQINWSLKPSIAVSSIAFINKITKNQKKKLKFIAKLVIVYALFKLFSASVLRDNFN